MKLLLLFLLLTLPVSASEIEPPNYCVELAEVILDAVKDEVLTDKQAQDMINHCWSTAP